MKKKSILIAGGTGFIGTHLIKKLLEYDWNIHCIHLNKRVRNKLGSTNYINVNIKNKNLLVKKLKRINFDYIVNLAGHINHNEKKKTYDSHFLGTKNLIDLAIKKKVKKFVQIGSSVEYGFSKSPILEKQRVNIKKLKSVYGISKLKATEYLMRVGKEKKLDYVVLRPFLIFGPGQSKQRLIPNTINNCIRNKKFPCSSGNQIRDFLYVSDFINFILKVIIKPNIKNIILNVGSGNPVKVKNVIKLINYNIEKGRPQFGKIKLRKDEPQKLYPNIKFACQILNWRPKITLEKGIKMTIRSYRKPR